MGGIERLGVRLVVLVPVPVLGLGVGVKDQEVRSRE